MRHFPVKIVAFLQNPWHPPDTSQRHADLYRTSPRFRRLILLKSMTGGRLLKAFKDDYSRIHWDNANPEPVERAADWRLPDLAHMTHVIETEQPQVILTFGNLAKSGMKKLMLDHDDSVIHLPCHHPNARHRTQRDLDDFAEIVRLAAESIRIRENDLCLT